MSIHSSQDSSDSEYHPAAQDLDINNDDEDEDGFLDVEDIMDQGYEVDGFSTDAETDIILDVLFFNMQNLRSSIVMYNCILRTLINIDFSETIIPMESTFPKIYNPRKNTTIIRSLWKPKLYPQNTFYIPSSPPAITNPTPARSNSTRDILTPVSRLRSRIYSGQFSQDGTFFFSCAQDFRVRLYDTTDAYDWKQYKTIQGAYGSWTITDSDLSPDNKWVIYSTIDPVVFLARTDQEDDELKALRMGSAYCRCGIWSVRWSADAKEIVAGASDSSIYLYDVEQNRVTLRLGGHKEDVNAVSFGDHSSNILFSGSDDSYIKVWDRRSLHGGKESGVLIGHTEGITFIEGKGDGRYLVSNSKDQSCKLWDIRKMLNKDTDSLPDYSVGNFDYRYMPYPGPRCARHPLDCSVNTYTGHSVLKTLIRCHFSPCGGFLYSGSEDGNGYIWNIDGSLKKRIPFGGDGSCLRDVSWHPYEPIIAGSLWVEDQGFRGAEGGMVVRAQWGQNTI
ncbi:LEC14B protein [Neolecta irregularis DAH-3]|uniref:LEC14B protein n=1 Tax=Neolecta irregularis (strain DAH-3) TaxID=1198029 RepID=A0A1U7LH89_NEOID|nr:LEC14B protein [Neolecta irregularis DAH-3]|eukprot:OLL22017.1 LEC14B protein [Neolecta irregularis DAH-3]